MKVAVLVLADPTESPRPRRLIRHLRGRGDEVVTMGLRNSDFLLRRSEKKTRLVTLAFRYLFKRYDALDREFVPEGAQFWLFWKAPDVVVVHDVKLLPWIVKMRGPWKIVLDLQEFYPDMLSTILWRLTMGRMYRHILTKYVGEADATWTVSGGLKELYIEQFNVTPRLVPNCPFGEDLSPSESKGPLRVIHHGYALTDRNLEAMIKAVRGLENVKMDLVLLAEPSWRPYHRRIVALAEEAGNVRVLDPVPIEEIVRTKNQYDIGLYVLAPENKNMENAMPNKFFDFLQARLCIVSGPRGEMAQTVKELGVGVVTNGYGHRDIRRKLEYLEKNRYRVGIAKRHSHMYAPVFSFEKFCAPIIDETLQELTK